MAEGLAIRLQAATGLQTVATAAPAAEQTEEPADGFRAARAVPMAQTEELFWHLAGLGKAQRRANLAKRERRSIPAAAVAVHIRIALLPGKAETAAAGEDMAVRVEARQREPPIPAAVAAAEAATRIITVPLVGLASV